MSFAYRHRPRHVAAEPRVRPAVRAAVAAHAITLLPRRPPNAPWRRMIQLALPWGRA